MRAWRERWAADDLRWSVVAVLLVAFAASASGLGNLFAYDDIPIVVENPMVTQLQSPLTYLTDSYWGPSRGNSLYRPLTIVAFGLEWAVGGGSPLPFHVANVLLYLASAVAALLLLRRLLPAGPALVGALAWAAHPVHVEAVANVVGQSEMWVAIPLLVATSAYLRDRHAGPLTPRTVVVIVACQAWALLHKEHGIVLPALLLAAEASFRGRGFAPAGPEASRQWVLARALVLTVAAYLVVRLAILGGLAGDAPHPALEGVPAGRRLWVMIGLAPEFLRLFLWPARLYADYSPHAIPFLDTPQLAHLPGLLILAALGAAFAWAWRRDRVIAFALLWTGLTMGPTANLLIPTGVLIAERVLFLPSLGVALVLARGVELAWSRLVAQPARWPRVAVPALGALLLVVAVARSAARQLDWADNPTVFATLVVDAPANYRAHHALGELFGAAAAWKRAEHELRIADSLYPGYDLLQLSLARVLHFDDRCPEALPLYDSVLARQPEAEVAAIGRTACLLEGRQFSEARSAALRGIGRGVSVGPFGMLLQKAESSLVANDTIDVRNRWYRAGGPTSKSDARLRVPVLLMRPGATGGRRKSPES